MNKVSLSVLLKAIRKKCLDCSGSVKKEVDECNLTTCPLYPYRSGNLILEKENKGLK